MTCWFVVGTDTNAGKTAVSRALLQAARARGLAVVGFKPVESGCPAGEFGPDTLLLAAAAQHAPACSYSLRDPVAPALAADREGVQICFKTIAHRAHDLRRQSDLMVIEGAGGFLAPISGQKTVADLALVLDLPLLIVAADKLGAINHSLLTIEAAQRRGLAVDAVILSSDGTGAQPGDLSLENASQLCEHTNVPILQLPRCNTEYDWAEAGESLLLDLSLANAKP